MRYKFQNKFSRLLLTFIYQKHFYLYLETLTGQQPAGLQPLGIGSHFNQCETSGFCFFWRHPTSDAATLCLDILLPSPCETEVYSQNSV